LTARKKPEKALKGHRIPLLEGPTRKKDPRSAKPAALWEKARTKARGGIAGTQTISRAEKKKQ